MLRGFFGQKTPLQAYRKSLERLLAGVRKVVAYRRDCLPPEGMQQLQEAQEVLQALLKKSDAEEEEIQYSCRTISDLLVQYGGGVYPQNFWVENAEVFLVAAIVALSFRTFFFQPFRIPTNSMYPTYAGMTFELFSSENPVPGSWRKLFRWIAMGTESYRIPCPCRGKVSLPLMNRNEVVMPYGGVLGYRVVDGRKWCGLLPTRRRCYRFYVSDTPIDIQVPLEFSLDDVILEAFFPDKSSWAEVFQGGGRPPIRYKNRRPYFRTAVRKRSDDFFLAFDILGGDMLFVNRLRYHFVRPRVGDPFVFRTRHIPGLMGSDKYYIKRIVGQGRDVLDVKHSQLRCNGRVLDECSAFRRNNAHMAPYRGYTASGSLVDGYDVRVPEGHFFAMGDNSPYSGDSRYWGPVPQKEVVGRAAFIFYPFTSRWGMAR